MWTINLIFFLFCFNLVSCKSVCNNFATCGECIGYGSERCVWCSQKNMKAVEDYRCQPEIYLNDPTKRWCDIKSIHNPQSAKQIEVENDFGETVKDDIIQFKPQVIKIKARPGIPVTFNMSYKPAKDFPLDVYYLMDNSYTMESHKQALISQAKEIYNQLNALTNNVHLGVGSFVEKPGYPYHDSNKQNNCHAFKHVLSLTEEVERFQTEIENVPFGANFDDMEAGLDALMQVMACEKEIGWRSGSRRIIVLCTDSPYHSAGDGKMLGIIKPNDMKCHLKDQKYALEMDQDYPSVSQINRVATLGKFTIIFAAIAEVRGVYTSLAKEIVGASYAELKAESNIVAIIKDAYIDSVQSVKLDYDMPSFAQLTLDQDCKAKPKRNCASTYKDPVVNIPATIRIQNCPAGNKSHELSIGPVTLRDKLIIKLDIICKCECEYESNISPVCNNVGYMQCGVCNCLETSYGDKCQCNVTSAGGRMKDFQKCKKNPEDTEVCSKHGECICGKCKCKEDYSGNHCEFNDKICPTTNSKLCSDHGKCTLGACHCNPGWTRDDCACSTKDDQCVAPYSKEVCSGNGVCECGRCKCDQVTGKNETYTGVFCDSCDECEAKYCKDLENYVECYYNNDKAYCNKIFNDTENIDVTIVNKTEINSPEWRGASWCKKMLEDGSFIIFRYYHDVVSHKLRIVIQREPETPPIANKWIALGSAIAAIVLIGLLTLIIWKILVDIHDKRDYAKFEEESRARGFDVSLNPLYQEPAINFSNPVYNRNLH